MTRLNKIFILLLFLAGLSFPQSKNIIALEYKEKGLPFGLVEKRVLQQPEVSLVLSGGGARGLAQVGMLRALSERNIPIDLIIGTSMGSIVGGLYSAGYEIKDLDSIARTTKWDDMLSFGDETNRRDLFVDQKITEDKAVFALRLDGMHFVIPTSISTGQKLSNYLNLLTLNAPIHINSSFDALRYKYRAVCTDLITGNIVVLNNGSLSQAMRASSSVSLFVSPVKLDSMLLVDGGLVANVPVQLAKDAGSDFIIAFNSTSPLNSEAELVYPWNVADQMVSIPMRILSQQQLKIADVVINPEIGNKKNSDFSNIDSLMQRGYNAALPYMDQIDKRIKGLFRSKLKEKEFYLKSVIFNENVESFARYYLYKYSRMDSVSSYEILNDLYTIFKSGDYDSLSVSYETVSDGTELRFNAVKNPTVKSFQVEGVTLLESEQVNSALFPLVNRPYNSGKLLQRLVLLLNMYRSRGYSLAELDTVGFDKKTGILKLRFTEGIISRILLEGNSKTNEEVIKREFPIEEGDYFRYGLVEQGLSNLRSTNLFSDINLTVKKVEGENIVLLKVLEKPSRLMRFGIRIDNENQTQFSVDIRDENVGGTGTEMGLILSGGIRNRSLIFEHKANRIFDTYITYKVRAYYEFNDIFSYTWDSTVSKNRFYRQIEGEYRQISQGISLAVGSQVGRFGNLIAEGRYQKDEIKNKKDFSHGTYKLNIAGLALGTTIDSQDKYPFPDKGVLMKAYYETAQKLFLGDVSYTKFYFDYKSYFTINSTHSIIPRVSLGFADRTLPLSQQFSLGGQNSFFGLRDNEFRGRQVLLTSLQYRYKLPFKIFFDTYFRLRYDLGSIWADREAIRFKDLRHGAGATISFDTPLGPADFSAGRSYLFRHDAHGNYVQRGPVLFYFTIGYYY